MTTAELKNSVYRTVRGVESKSCPPCSMSAGKLVFHPLSHFGDRQMGTQVAVQSWCSRCRAQAARKGGSAC